jgi:polyferredoxin
MNDIKISSNKSFGIVFFIVFLLIGLYPLIHYESVRIWSLIISFNFLVLGFLNSSILTPLNLLWFKFGILLGKLISPIIMGVVFFLVVTPIGLIMRLFKKDLLKLKKNDAKSYWIEKSNNESSMKNQF